MWIFENPKTYPEMCTKIAKSFFVISFIELFIFAQISKDFAILLEKLSFDAKIVIPGINLTIYLSYIYLPLTLAIMENIFKLHDRFGALLRIRKRNAKRVIFKEYLKELNISGYSKKEYKEAYSKNRSLQNAIGKHFYYYVSYSEPKIDKHEVYMALDAWTWFWIFLDTIIFTILFIITLILITLFWFPVSPNLIIGLSAYTVLLIVIDELILRYRCAKYTRREIQFAVRCDRENNEDKMNNTLKEAIKNALSN